MSKQRPNCVECGKSMVKERRLFSNRGRWYCPDGILCEGIAVKNTIKEARKKVDELETLFIGLKGMASDDLLVYSFSIIERLRLILSDAESSQIVQRVQTHKSGDR